MGGTSAYVESLKGNVEFRFSVCKEAVDECIGDPTHSNNIKQIIDHVFAQCENDRHAVEWKATPLNLDEEELFHRKYPFVSNAIKSIKKLVGEEMFDEMK